MEITQEKFDDLREELKDLETSGFKRVMEEKLSAGGPMESFHQSASANEQFLRWQKRVSGIKTILRRAKIIKKKHPVLRVEIGSYVDLRSDSNQVQSFQIVNTV